LNPRDEQREKTEKKRSGEPLPADILANKKISAESSESRVSVLPSDSSAKPSLPNRPSEDYAASFRYCSKDKPPYLVQIQPVHDTDSTSFHPLHISRTLSQIFPREILEIRKIGRNRITVEMRTYEAANRLVENKSLKDCNLKAFIPIHRILRIGIIKDVPQDFSTDMIRESIAFPVKVLDIHRLNRRVRVENEVKYLPSRTVCQVLRTVSSQFI